MSCCRHGAVRRQRFGETGHRPVATAFVIGISGFLRPSSFGFRHFANCRCYDGKVAGESEDFQMEIFPHERAACTD